MTVAGKNKDQNLNRIKYVHLEFDSKYRIAISLYIPIFELNLLQLYNIYRKKKALNRCTYSFFKAYKN